MLDMRSGAKAQPEVDGIADPDLNRPPIDGVTHQTDLSPLRCVDLFSGCGGMSLGFERAGHNVVAAFEYWKPAVDVYEANFSHPIFNQDLSNVEAAVEAIRQFSPNLIIGGPPCQDFSTAGRQDESGGRAILSVKYSEIIAEIRPQYFVMENVATIQKTKSFSKTIENFKKAGYGVTKQVLDSAYCGVPQSRKRMFVIGSLGEKDGFLDASILGNLSRSPMTIHDYLGDSLGIEHYFRVPTNYSRRAVFSIYEPSVTVRAVDRPIPKGYLGNPRDSAPVSSVRGLTPVERSYIQTFPHGFKLFGGKSNMNAMIGNAVPVNLARYVGEALKRHHQKQGDHQK